MGKPRTITISTTTRRHNYRTGFGHHLPNHPARKSSFQSSSFYTDLPLPPATRLPPSRHTAIDVEFQFHLLSNLESGETRNLLQPLLTLELST